RSRAAFDVPQDVGGGTGNGNSAASSSTNKGWSVKSRVVAPAVAVIALRAAAGRRKGHESKQLFRLIKMSDGVRVAVLGDDAFVCGAAKPRHKFATIRVSTLTCRRTTIPAVHSIEEPFDVRL